MKLSSIYSDGMILQRDEKNMIWGQATAGEEISLFFDLQAYVTHADENGRFQFVLPARQAGGNYTIELADANNNTLCIHDVVFGDVFLLGGQSNMELPLMCTLDNYRKELKDVNNQNIRMFQVAKDPNLLGAESMFTSGSWETVNNETIMNYSAIGYFFANAKQMEDGVPVGLVHTAVGGAPIEALMSKGNILEQAEKIRKKGITCTCNGNKSMACLACYDKMFAEDVDPDRPARIKAEDQKRIEAWYTEIEENDPGKNEDYINLWADDCGAKDFTLPGFFLDTEYDIKGTVWMQKVIDVPEKYAGSEAILAVGTLTDSDKTYLNGELVGETGYKYPPRRYEVKKGIVKAGANVITIRFCMDANVGGAAPDMPYELQFEDGTAIDITGTWKIRKGYEIGKALECETFYIWHPSALFNSMIAPLKGYNFKTVLFYQGESNCEFPQYYGDLFMAMVNEWRDVLNKKVPFICCEVTHYMGDGPVYVSDPFDAVRAAQNEAVKHMDEVYLTKTYDLGQYNELHPQNKKDVALRMLEIYHSECE